MCEDTSYRTHEKDWLKRAGEKQIDGKECMHKDSQDEGLYFPVARNRNDKTKESCWMDNDWSMHRDSSGEGLWCYWRGTELGRKTQKSLKISFRDKERLPARAYQTFCTHLLSHVIHNRSKA